MVVCVHVATVAQAPAGSVTGCQIPDAPASCFPAVGDRDVLGIPSAFPAGMRSRWLLVTAVGLACFEAAARAQPVAEPESPELQVALGAAPTGLMGVRLSLPIGPGLRLEPGLGLGESGTIGSLVLALRLLRTQPTPTRSAQLLVYAGYAASLLSDGQRGPLASARLPSGVYQWLDLGLAAKTRVAGVVLTVGGGISRRLRAPAGLGTSRSEDDELWPLTGDGWIAHEKTLPAFWCSLGRSF